MTQQHPVSHMWIWLEAHCGLSVCMSSTGSVLCLLTGSISRSKTTRCARRIHLGRSVPVFFFCCCCYWHPDTQWPAGWSLVALSFLMEQSDKQRTVRTSASPRGKVTLSRSHQMCPQGLFMKSILNTSVQSVCLILSAALRNENSHNSVFKWSHIGKMKENYFFWQKYLSLMKKVCLLCCLLHLCALTMQWIKVEFSSWWCHKMHAPWCSFRSLKLPHNQLDLVSFQNNLDRSRQASVFAEWFCSRL